MALGVGPRLGADGERAVRNAVRRAFPAAYSSLLHAILFAPPSEHNTSASCVANDRPEIINPPRGDHAPSKIGSEFPSRHAKGAAEG